MIKSPVRFWENLQDDLLPSLTHWVGPLLYDLCRLIEAENTVEIGVGRGYMSAVLGLYAKENEANHFVVDLNPDKYTVVDMLNEKFDLSIRFVCADAVDVKLQSPLNLIFVDLLSDYETMAKILKNLKDQVVVDGYIVVHDYFGFNYIRKATNNMLWDFQILSIPSDGRPRMEDYLKGPCGLAICRRVR